MKPEFSISDIKDTQPLKECDFSILFNKKQQGSSTNDVYRPLEKLSTYCTEVSMKTLDNKNSELNAIFIENKDFQVHRFINDCIGDKVNLNGISFFIGSCFYQFRSSSIENKIQEIHVKFIVRKTNVAND